MIRVELPLICVRWRAFRDTRCGWRWLPPATVRGVLDCAGGDVSGTAGDDSRPWTGERRAYMRLFACQQDISHDSQDAPLPVAVVNGSEPLIILGAVAGGDATMDETA